MGFYGTLHWHKLVVFLLDLAGLCYWWCDSCYSILQPSLDWSLACTTPSRETFYYLSTGLRKRKCTELMRRKCNPCFISGEFNLVSKIVGQDALPFYIHCHIVLSRQKMFCFVLFIPGDQQKLHQTVTRNYFWIIRLQMISVFFKLFLIFSQWVYITKEKN